jgi:hypothetical protein
MSRLVRILGVSAASALALVLGSAAPSMAAASAPARGAAQSSNVAPDQLRFVPACQNCQGGRIINMAHGLCLDADESGDGSNGDKVQL